MNQFSLLLGHPCRKAVQKAKITLNSCYVCVARLDFITKCRENMGSAVLSKAMQVQAGSMLLIKTGTCLTRQNTSQTLGRV